MGIPDDWQCPEGYTMFQSICWMVVSSLYKSEELEKDDVRMAVIDLNFELGVNY